MSTGGGGLAGHPHLKFILKELAPLKLKLLGIYFIGLKWYLDIFRKSQEASAFNFDCMGARNKILCKGGPPVLIGLKLIYNNQK